MKIYIATKFENVDGFREAQQKLEIAGHKITYDWTKSTGVLTEEAIKDTNGVIDCDVLVGLFDKEHIYKGALIEVGMAVVSGKKIFIIGDYLDEVVFSYLPVITKVKSIEEVIMRLDSMQQKNLFES